MKGLIGDEGPSEGLIVGPATDPFFCIRARYHNLTILTGDRYPPISWTRSAELEDFLGRQMAPGAEDLVRRSSSP